MANSAPPHLCKSTFTAKSRDRGCLDTAAGNAYHQPSPKRGRRPAVGHRDLNPGPLRLLGLDLNPAWGPGLGARPPGHHTDPSNLANFL